MKLRTVIGCLIGGFGGALVGTLAYAVAFRHDGDGNAAMLLIFGAFFGGVPGFVLGTALGAVVSCQRKAKPGDNVPRD